MSFWYSCFCSASLSSPLRRTCRCNCWATRLAERSRQREVCSTERTCSATSPVARLTRAREHTHPVQKPPTVGGMVDLGLHTGRIQPQLTSLRHLGLPGQLDHADTLAHAAFRVAGCSPNG